MNVDFSSEFLTDHLITYIGNKRKLLPFINNAIDDIKQRLGNDHPTMLDGFSGTGCVARMFKHYASSLWVNDFEHYSETVNTCYLCNKSDVPDDLCDAVDRLNSRKFEFQPRGFIERNYAPRDDNDIQQGERVFYTNQNAKIIDNIRRMIDGENAALRPFLIAPLLVKASIHANTSGLFRYHKKEGIGHFGGSTETALGRIKKAIDLDCPVFCDQENEVHIIKGDMNHVLDQIPEVDIAYYDPPYNRHPYGSNYFMLNIIDRYDAPLIQHGTMGIVEGWNKSLYNKKQYAEQAMDDLIGKTKAKYVLISYNEEGIIPISAFRDMLARYGEVELRARDYLTYRGSQSFGKGKTLRAGGERAPTVQELLWVLKK